MTSDDGVDVSCCLDFFCRFLLRLVPVHDVVSAKTNTAERNKY